MCSALFTTAVGNFDLACIVWKAMQFLFSSLGSRHFCNNKSYQRKKKACGFAAPQVSGELFSAVPKDAWKEMVCSRKR